MITNEGLPIISAENVAVKRKNNGLIYPRSNINEENCFKGIGYYDTTLLKTIMPGETRNIVAELLHFCYATLEFEAKYLGLDEINTDSRYYTPAGIIIPSNDTIDVVINEINPQKLDSLNQFWSEIIFKENPEYLYLIKIFLNTRIMSTYQTILPRTSILDLGHVAAKGKYICLKNQGQIMGGHNILKELELLLEK